MATNSDYRTATEYLIRFVTPRLGTVFEWRVTSARISWRENGAWRFKSLTKAREELGE